jgi:hypothetical protein
MIDSIVDNSDVVERITEVTVCALPEAYPSRFHWEIKVAYRGDDRWAVVWAPFVLSFFSEAWVYEPLPSSRTDEWLAEHRGTYEQALRLARKHAPIIKINGRTAAQALKDFPA